MAPVKYLIAAIASMYLLVMGTSTLIDFISDSSSVEPQAEFASESSESEEELLKQLLAGADPTDLFEPTAAGRPVAPACFSGELEIDDSNLTSLNGARFVSQDFQGDTYITLLTLPPVYLHQTEHQAVSATRVEELPDGLYPQVGQVLNQKETCAERSLYLSRID